jgi:predicted metal-dependent hydrolase
MSMQGSAMMYVTPASLARPCYQLVDKLSSPLHECRLRDDLVEAGCVSPLQARTVGVVREAENGGVRPLLDDLLRLDARDVGDHEVRFVDAVARHQTMIRQKPFELAAEVQVDPDEQDRRHVATLAPQTDADNHAAMGLERGLELIRAGDYFEAHEELEDEWRDAPAEERDFLQGLVHVAVAWYQAGRDNKAGCERQLEKAARRLGPYAPAYRGVDIAAILRGVQEAQKTVATGSLTLRRPPV